MNFVAEATVESLTAQAGRFVPRQICPTMVRRFSRGQAGNGYNLDRLLNRFWDYPKTLRNVDRPAQLHHVIDHSYAQLVHELPATRTVVTCHDAETFRSLTHPSDERRSGLFRLMTRRTLSGLQRAARVCCDSDTTRRSLIAADLVRADRLRTVPLPVHPDFSPCVSSEADTAAAKLLAGRPSLDLLHVGSTVQRKRIELLLEIVARIKSREPTVRLLRVGGAFTAGQEALVERLGIRAQILCLPPLDRRILAAVYSRAALVLLTSEREGFGLPLLEAIASGTVVLATDLPIMREVGADAAVYCPFNDVEGWVNRISALLEERQTNKNAWDQRRQVGIVRARAFSYGTYAQQLTAIYSELA